MDIKEASSILIYLPMYYLRLSKKNESVELQQNDSQNDLNDDRGGVKRFRHSNNLIIKLFLWDIFQYCDYKE